MPATVEAPVVDDRAADIQRRTKDLASLFERNAYRVYNLALRITCEPDAAMRAATRAFLDQLEDEAGLLPAVVKLAVSEAKDEPQPSGAGDADAEELLRATVALSAPERAALALAWLTDEGPDAVAPGLGLPAEGAAQLLERALHGLQDRAGQTRSEATEAISGWLWAEPPQELWERVYHGFYRSLGRHDRRVLETTAGDRGAAAAPGGRRLAVPFAWPQAVAAVAALVVVAGVAVVAMGSGDAPKRSSDIRGVAPPSRPQTPTPGVGGSSYRSGAVLPKESEALRRKGLSRKERVRRLKALMRQRRRALARRRRALAKQRRRGDGKQLVERYFDTKNRHEKLLKQRMALERRRARRQRPPRQRPPKGGGKQTPSAPQPPPRDPAAPPTRKQAEAECLFNQDTGTYVCPE